MKFFVGSCVTGLDRDGFRNAVADDATELAQLVEAGQRITQDTFRAVCRVTERTAAVLAKHRKRFLFFSNMHVYWIYDKRKDIHYFYV